MKGLLRKEFYTMQSQLRSWILVVGVMSLYSVFMKSPNQFPKLRSLPVKLHH